MSYEFRNGKYYKVEEVNVTDIEKEVKQTIAFINQEESSIVPLRERVNDIENKKIMAIEKLNQEIAKLSATYNAEINAYNAEINKHLVKIQNAKAVLGDKSDMIRAIFPNEANKLGF